MNNHIKDIIILSPQDIDLDYSPIRKALSEKTSVLGAFNPALTKLPNGNLLMMVRVAEQLDNPIDSDNYKFIRWDNKRKYVIDLYPINKLNQSDPRKFELNDMPNKTYGLTSFSWLLPVELNNDGTEIVKIHYDKIIEPTESYQEFGIEDARITKIENKYYMTACAVSSYRHSTILYSSIDGLNYSLLGIIQDHQNKDVVLFPSKISGYYYSLTRPMGEHFFSSDINSQSVPGPSICMSRSPDLLHWKPVEEFIIQPVKDSFISEKVGGGTNPILTEKGWLILFHGVEKTQSVGKYRTFYAMLNKDEPSKIESLNISKPVLEAMDNLSDRLEKISYVDNVVFSTGVVEHEDIFIVASGERDLCCRITHFTKNALINFN